jgi:hypothetical protein
MGKREGMAVTNAALHSSILFFSFFKYGERHDK